MKKLLYIDACIRDEQSRTKRIATPYLKALSWLWGIGPLEVVSAQNMDYISETEIEERISKAIYEGLEVAENF